MKKLLLFFLLMGSLAIIAAVPVKAQHSLDLPSVIVTPDSFYYPLKRLIEKIQVNFFINSESKADFYKGLAQKRLAELKHVVDRDYLDQVERSTQRVSYQVGILTDYIVGKKLDKKKLQIKDLFKKDKVILEQLRDKYPANSSFWMLIQHSINSIDINLQKL